ncbi:hypothetical protein HG537_0A04230 [Torulaspora globosa]|uniref:HECT-type E3 ubiquitin transferase n=1 Tax=Torulaspora globosa TaxID=48254 RepID=A0A7H9HLH4_9SACH|nr:hypothetical protein HG537_0A04230 [Torulaspora sp. CBS 2947]
MEDMRHNDDQGSGSSDFVMEDDHSLSENRYSYQDAEDGTSSSNGGIENGDYDDEDEIYIDEDQEGEDIGSNNEEIGSDGSPGAARSFSVQGFLGNLAQTLSEGGSSGRNRGRQGGMNLSEVFPEILSVLNDGGRTGQMGRGVRNERVQRLVNNVANAVDDPYIAMESIKELSEHLLMMDQVIVERIFPIDKLVASLVDLISNANLKNELELQLVSCRCLYNLFEISPESMAVAVDQNVIPALQELLQEISYIDLAEQVLETLELISRVHPKDILRSGGLTSCLQYLDFFTIHAQRKAVGIVSNACSRVQLQDFDTIKELLIILKPIFVNAEDQVMIVKLLNSLYGICGGLRRDYMVEDLFTVDVITQILQLVASSETHLDSKLKCLEIVTVLVSISGQLALEVIEKCDIARVISECFGHYAKSPDAALHETLMFVPKPLLHSMARTISVLFPAEYEQILSVDTMKEAGLKFNSDNLDQLLKNLTPLMVEIYVNAVDFEVRRYVLIALARISSRLTSGNIASVDGYMIRLASSALAQNQSLLEKENDQLLVATGSIAGILSLLDVLAARFAPEILPKLKREGIFSLLQALQSTLDKLKDEGHDSLIDNQEGINNDRNDSNDQGSDEEDDDGHGLQFGIIDIPDEAEPKKIRFNILRPLTLSYTYNKMCELSRNLLLLSEENEQTVIKELQEIEDMVKYLDSLKAETFSCETWFNLWSNVKACIFSGSFEISSFEFVSTGLATALSRIVEEHGFKNTVPRKTFFEVFGPSSSKFVNILQSALTRIESFEIVDCGLTGDEGRVASLGKQVKIKLLYDSDAQKDNVPEQLTNLTISIHCISSFSALNEFLRHRIAQARFLHSLLPNLSGPGTFDSESGAIENVKNWMFEFYNEDEKFKLTETIFGAIYKASKANGNPLTDIWHSVQTIKFKRIDSHESKEPMRVASIYKQDQDSERNYFKPAESILTLLKFTKIRQLPNDIFINAKLSAKLSRQLEEPLVIASGILPAWSLQLTKDYNFVFPLETRLFFLQCTSFGYGRLVQMWRNRVESLKDSNADDTLQHLGRITRHKLRISRETMFLSGLKILDKYGASPSVLEIEYQGEVGTGLGPTLEFYASISREFTKRSLKMWRCEDYGGTSAENEGNYVTNPLFPAPLDPSKDNTRIVELFRYLGIFVARSMLDNRILDFCFSTLFFELAHRQCRATDNNPKIKDVEEKLELLASIDPHLAKSVRYLHKGKDSTELEQMALTFTLPGFDIELKKNGKQLLVTPYNVDEYVNRILDYTLHDGVQEQLESFIEGVSSVFPYSSLLILTPEELVELHGRFEEDWSPQTLYASINADHGYSMGSSTIHGLVSIMSSFKTSDRRLFLQFLTGSPKLPIGGFKGLKPKLTVVLKHPEDGQNPDAYLPSVMTCANYFKLPKYSSEEMMRSRIVQAMNEGSSAFLLS